MGAGGDGVSVYTKLQERLAELRASKPDTRPTAARLSAALTTLASSDDVAEVGQAQTEIEACRAVLRTTAIVEARVERQIKDVTVQIGDLMYEVERIDDILKQRERHLATSPFDEERRQIQARWESVDARAESFSRALAELKATRASLLSPDLVPMLPRQIPGV